MGREKRTRMSISARMRGLGGARTRVAGGLASLVAVVATLVAVVLVLHVIFVVFSANPDNSIVVFVRDISDSLVWKFQNLFQPDSLKEQVLVNYGLAALVYLVVGRIVARIVRRVG